MPKTITSANTIYTLNAPAVFSVPQTLQGFQSDNAFTQEAVEAVTAIMGVDGFLSAGYTPYATKQTIHIQADSPSLDIFQAIVGAMNSPREVVRLDSVWVVPSLEKIFTFTKGFLTKPQPIPDAKKTMEGVDFEITWESVTFAPSN